VFHSLSHLYDLDLQVSVAQNTVLLF